MRGVAGLVTAALALATCVACSSGSAPRARRATVSTTTVSATDGRLTALDVRTGRERWTDALPFPVVMQKPLVAGSTVIGYGSGRRGSSGYGEEGVCDRTSPAMVAVNDANGNERWRANTSPLGIESDRFVIADAGRRDNRAPNDDAKILDASTGAVVNRRVYGGASWLVGNVGIVPIGLTGMSGIDVRSGKQLWKNRVSINGPASANDDATLYLFGNPSISATRQVTAPLVAISANSGHTVWTTLAPGERAAIVRVGDTLVTTSVDQTRPGPGTYAGFDVRTGQLLWRHRAVSVSSYSNEALVTDGTFAYALQPDHRLVASGIACQESD